MKIPKILYNRTLRQTGLFLGMAIPMLYCTNRCENNIVNGLKSELYTKDSLRYKRVEQQTCKMHPGVSKSIWIKELAEAEDSLKLDNIIKKAYFEGAQMVRDSIINHKLSPDEY